MKKFLLSLLLISTSVLGADSKISDLPLGSGAGITYSSVFPYVQIPGYLTKKLTIYDLINVPAFTGTYAKLLSPQLITPNIGAASGTSLILSGAISASNLSGSNTNDVTLGTANGLSLTGQALSLVTSSASTTGALTSANWSTFNSKEPAITATTSDKYYRGDKSFQTLDSLAVAIHNNTSTNAEYVYLYNEINHIWSAGVIDGAALTDNGNGTVNIASAAVAIRTAILISSITRSGTTATVTTSTSHGLSDGDHINIRGADQSEYNIFAFTTVTGLNTFTYQVAGSPATPATGALINALPEDANMMIQDVPATTNLALSDHLTNWVYVDNLSGTAAYGVTTDKTKVVGLARVYVYMIQREGNTLWPVDYRVYNVDSINKIQKRQTNTDGFKAEQGGVILTASGTRNIAISSGIFWYGLNQNNFGAFDSSASSKFTTAYTSDSGTTWTYTTGQSIIGNTQYNSIASGLSSIPIGSYGVYWVYVMPNMPASVMVLYGQNSYNHADAYAAQEPTIKPVILSNGGALIGKIIILQGASSFDGTISSYAKVFPPSKIYLDYLADVNAPSPAINDHLIWNGSNWTNGASSSVSGGPGLSYYNASPTITATGSNNAIVINTLSSTPVTTAEQTVAISLATNTVTGSAWLFDTALGRTSIDAGQWNFTNYAGVNSVGGGRVTTITRQIYSVLPAASGTVTMTGTLTSRTVTASTGTPFATSAIDASATNTAASFLQTASGLYQITARTSDTVVTIATPTGYSNDSAVTYKVWKKLFGSTSGPVTSITPNYAVTSWSSVQPAFTITALHKLGAITFGTSNNTTTLTTTYDGNTHSTYFQSPLSVLHDMLSGLQGGTSGEYYHLTSAEYSGTGVGSGNIARLTSPAFTTPNIGSASGTSVSVSGQLSSTQATGTAPLVVASTTRVSNLNVATAGNADTVTTNANLTGVITSSGNATSIASQTGTGSKFVVDDTPTLITPNIGAATGTSLSVSGQLASTVTTGTAPLSVLSTTRVTNLNAATAGNADTVTTIPNLTGDVTSSGNSTSYGNVVPIAKGGTNNGSLAVTAGGTLYTDGSKLVNVGIGTAGQVLTSNASSAPTWATPAGGGGSKNYFTTAENNGSSIGSFTAFADAAASLPVDMTGGSPNAAVTFATSATTPISGTDSLIFTKDASNRQGTGWSRDFTIDASDQGKVLAFTMNYKINSGTYADGDVIVYFYDATAGALAAPTPYKILNHTLASDRFFAEVQVPTGCTTFRIGFYIASTSATGYALKIDDLSFGPAAKLYGSPVTDYTSTRTFVPSAGFGTIAGSAIFSKREGDELIVTGKFEAGTVAGTVASISLAGLKIDTTKIFTGSARQWVGSFTVLPQGAQTNWVTSGYSGFIYYNGSDTANLYMTYQAGGTASNTFNTTNVNGFMPNNTTLSFYFRVPIAGWSASQLMSDSADTRVIAAYMTGSAATATTGNPIIMPTVVKDSHAAYNASTGRYTVPVTGWYQMTMGGAVTAGTGARLIIYKNAVLDSIIGFVNSTDGLMASSGMIYAIAGDIIDIRPNATVAGMSANSSMSIMRISGPAQIMASERPKSWSWYNTAAGFGSTNTKIRRIETLVSAFGPDITYASTAAAGSSWTINTAGVYTINYRDTSPAVDQQIGISVNSSELTTGIGAIIDANRVSIVEWMKAGDMGEVHATVYCNVGDVIRAHTDASQTATAARATAFRITRVN